MRADRLLSLLLLLRHHGRLSAAAIAEELEVSPRTVLRDVEALSAAGVPVYAERGRHGGFALLPGYTTDLTGLTPDEALALLVAGSRGDAADLGPDLASAMRKVVAGLPESRREAATRDAGRILVRRDGWIRPAPDEARLAVVRQAVFAGRRLRLRYAARGERARWRTVDPIGLVSAGGRWYLLATRDEEERSYRLSRVEEVQELDEAADRPADVDLDRLWRERRERWSDSLPGLLVRVRVRSARRADLLRTARPVAAPSTGPDGWTEVTAQFGDAGHAQGVLWSLGPDVEVLEPEDLRAALAGRARATAALYPAARGDFTDPSLTSQTPSPL